jgi:NAD(P)-dependent dehydrogenase (short-subunit alcohol dehydrogenase family)
LPRGHCQSGIELGGIDILVNNAAASSQLQVDRRDQRRRMGIDLQGQHPCDVLSYQGRVGHMKPGSCHHQYRIDQSDAPNPSLLAYATTKGAIHNFTAGLAQMLAEKGIRANAVAPGPIWTPLIPSTLPEDAVANFGKQVPMQRRASRSELATAYVMLADPLSSYVSGATIAVTGGKPFL